MTSKSRFSLFNGNSLPERPELNIPPISLMWPDEKKTTRPAEMPWQRDLGLQEIINHLLIDRRYTNFINQTLVALTTEVDVIAWRQSVLRDFVNNPDLVKQIEVFLPRFSSLRQGTRLLGHRSRNLLMETADRLSELELYTDIVREFAHALEKADIQSDALMTLRDHMVALAGEERFTTLCNRLPELRKPLENVSSITVGINLDLQMRPVSAVLLSINEGQLSEKSSWLDRLLGARREDDPDIGVGALHKLPEDPEVRRYVELFQDLDNLMTQVALPIARELNRYVHTSSNTLMNLEFELAFYVAGVHLTRQITDFGAVFCQPKILAPETRLTEINDLVNINLILNDSNKAVPSRVDFGADGRIAILTGPNSGGKTTYIQSVGLAQILFQAGWFIPAKSARMSPVDSILTHFPQLETRKQGRLAEEAERLRGIFQQTTGHSLVLLNETFSSTASGEAIYLAQDILCGLRVIGARVVYATHFVELVEHIEEIESLVDGDSRLCSLVAGVEIGDDGKARPTYKITRGKPLGRSYAREIAKRHGISLEQILEVQRNTDPK